MANDFLKTKQISKKVDELRHYGVRGMHWGIRKQDDAIEAKVISEHKTSIDGKPTEDQVEVLSTGAKGVLTGVKGITDSAAKGLDGKKKENKSYKKYPDLDDKDLAAKLKRLQMEQQYSDLTGDTVVTKTGSEKAKDALQTIGAVAGIGASLIGIGYAIYQMRHGQSSGGGK